MAVRYEKIVEEDLNVGTEPTWVTNPGRGLLRVTQVGIHSFARGQQRYTKAWTPGVIAAGSYATTTVTVPDADVADMVMVSFTGIVTNKLLISGHVSSGSSVKALIRNPTSSAVALAAGTLAAVVFPIGGDIIAEGGAHTFLVRVGIRLDGVPLDACDPNYTWTLALWRNTSGVAGAVGAPPAGPAWVQEATQNVTGSQGYPSQFFSVPAGVYSALATTTSTSPFGTVEANAYNNPSVLIDEATYPLLIVDLTDLPFTSSGGGGGE